MLADLWYRGLTEPTSIFFLCKIGDPGKPIIIKFKKKGKEKDHVLCIPVEVHFLFDLLDKRTLVEASFVYEKTFLMQMKSK